MTRHPVQSTMTSTRREPPPHLYFVVSAVFHYLGPSFAVLLFARVAVLGVAWLRIASAAAVFALWRRPWRTFLRAGREAQGLLVAWAAGRPRRCSAIPSPCSPGSASASPPR